jgi:hypothetical protein
MRLASLVPWKYGKPDSPRQADRPRAAHDAKRGNFRDRGIDQTQ